MYHLRTSWNHPDELLTQFAMYLVFIITGD